MNVIELFSGTGIISQAFKNKGHATFTIDNRRRKGVCEPDLKKDVLDLKRKDIPFKKCHVVWASPPCDVWSYAAVSTHWKENTPQTKKCLEHILLLKSALQFIQELRPGLFFIENPRGKMRYSPIMIDFLIKSQGLIKEFTMSSYGNYSKKPTNLFTNAYDFQLKHLDSFGRGAKNNSGVVFNNLTKCQRQKLPGTFAKDIVKYCEKKIPRG